MKTYIERNMFDVWFFVRFNFFQFFLFDVTRAIDAHEYHEFVLLLKWAGDFRAVEHHVGELCQGYPWFAPLGPVYALWWGASKKSWLIFPEAFAVPKNGSARSSASFLSHFDSSVDWSSPAKVPTVHTMRSFASTNWYDFDGSLLNKCSRQLWCNSASLQQFLEYRKHPENQHKNPKMRCGRWHFIFKECFWGSCWFSGEHYCPMFSVHMKTHDKSWHLEVAPDVVGSRWHTTDRKSVV